MITSDDDELADHIKFLVNQAKDPAKGYFHPEIGFNYRMTNLEASVGLAQMERLEEFLGKKRRFAEIYRDAFSGERRISLQEETPGSQSSWWLTSIMIKDGDKSIPQIQEDLKKRGVPTRRVFVPVTEFPPYRQFGDQNDFPVAYSIFTAGLNLPSSTQNGEKEVLETAKKIKDAEF